jgi:preprotein translocase subunit SecA
MQEILYLAFTITLKTGMGSSVSAQKDPYMEFVPSSFHIFEEVIDSVKSAASSKEQLSIFV